VLGEHGIGKQAGYPPVAVLERVDDEKVDDEQPAQEHRMVLAVGDRLLVAPDQVIDGERGHRGGQWPEPDGCRAVWRPVHDQVVLGLERPAGNRGVSEEQSVQVQDQTGLQWAPVLLEQVVLGVAVARKSLIAYDH